MQCDGGAGAASPQRRFVAIARAERSISGRAGFLGDRRASSRAPPQERKAMILSPRRVQGLKVNPGTGKKFDLIKLAGPGVFVAAHVTKQGGSNDITQVALFIDGVNVVAITYAAADNIGMDGVNN